MKITYSKNSGLWTLNIFSLSECDTKINLITKTYSDEIQGRKIYRELIEQIKSKQNKNIYPKS